MLRLKLLQLRPVLLRSVQFRRGYLTEGSSARAFEFPTAYSISSEHQVLNSVMKIWSLLDASLSNNEYQRGLDLLKTLYGITDFNRPKDYHTFMIAYNKYLLAWSKTASLQEIDAFVTNRNKEFAQATVTSRTIAILVRKAMSEDKPYTVYLNMWREHKKPISEVLLHTDVLTVSGLKHIFEDLKLPLNSVPEEYRELIKSTKFSKIDSRNVIDVLEDEETTWEGEIPTLKKLDLEELQGVDSFGLKVIRNSLLGLKMNQDEELFKTFFNNLKVSDYVEADTHSINFFAVYKSLKTDAEKEQFNELLNGLNLHRQKLLEARSIDGAEKSWQHSADTAKKLGQVMFKDTDMNGILWEWYSRMLPLVKMDVDLCNRFVALGEDKKSKKKEEFNDGELLRLKSIEDVAHLMGLVNPEKMAVITILELLRLVSTGGVVDGMKSARAVIAVGKSIQFEYNSQVILKKEEETFGNLFTGVPQGTKLRRLKEIVERSRNRFRTVDDEIDDSDWPTTVRAKIGSILVSSLIKVAKIKVSARDPRTGQEVTSSMPAFLHTYQFSAGFKLGVIKLHNELLAKLGTQNLQYSIYPQSLPMLTLPRPWTSWNDGGYNFSRSTIIRTKNSPEQVAYIRTASKRGGMEKIYEGLNALGQTAWTVNERILKILTKVWNTGDDFLAIPRNIGELKLPPRPARDADPSLTRNWQRECKRVGIEYSTNRSLRCDTNYKLEIARAFVGERFYFPHNMDFRGRTYPLSPHFNHLGNDLSRGLLIFWEGRKLGPRGLFWLKIHLANLFGHSKLKFEDREAFVNNHMKDIEASVSNPFDRNSFWLTAEDPWQALAVMLELVDALKLDDPSEFISHQPVHQDGTCNGLQHYAAIGGDIEGATQVNLRPSPKPQDVYNEVAQITRKLLEKEAEEGQEFAIKLLPILNRKIIKQTVMTNVYGVTYVGATAQIRKQLFHYMDPDTSYNASIYLTRFVFEAIRSLFSGAHLIQDWLGDCAKRICKSTNVLDVPEDELDSSKGSFMSSVIWTTPLGLPVVQPYRKVSKKQIDTNLQTMFLQDPNELNSVSAHRQANGFPPNYIHSLDATHMLLSAVECSRKGLVFASVHDSYWTHASSIDDMNKIIREKFVQLHQNSLIESLRREFQTRYKANMLVLSVPKSSTPYQKVWDFKKRYKKETGIRLSLAEELKLERRRLQGEDVESTISILTEEEISQCYRTCTNLKWASEPYEGDENKGDSKGNLVIPFRCPATPPKGEFNVEEVLESKYFFS